MKKLYVFLGQSILGNGGGQIYLLNKKEYLESLGYDVIIFSYHTKGEILYSQFELFKNDIFPEFEFSLNFFKPSYIKKILSKILLRINPLQYSEIIIESNWIGSSEWGELLSSTVRAKHIIYLISEHNYAGYSSDFLMYKHLKKEISAISENVIKELFTNVNELKLNEFSVISAGCFSLSYPQNIPCKELEVIINDTDANTDYIISYFGRLEKLDILYIREICNVANKYPNFKFLFIALGYNDKSEICRFNSITSIKPSNLEIRYLEIMAMVPRLFFDSSNVIIASAGCAVIAALNHKLTISMEVNKKEPIGVLGITTKQTTFSDIKTNVPLSVFIEDVLINKRYLEKDIDMSHIKSIQEISRVKFIKFAESYKDNDYYDFKKRQYNNNILSKSEIRRVLIKIIGVNNVVKYRKIKYNY